MDYGDFEEIELPNLTVTEPNPSHQLAFRRFCSDQVVAFNRVQVDIIRTHSNAPITHNYMGKVTNFDHFDVGADLDFASWDSYPLGFLEDRAGADQDLRERYIRQGHPDFQAFHHDLYRAVGRGRWWVMEQQPGPVNWAPYNPAPLPGMIRLWTWEAFAHGAEAVCYFRWRQVPFAQEQMHAGMLRPDSSEAAAMADGTDTIFGGAGNDEIHTGSWADGDQGLANVPTGVMGDIAYGEAGNDILRGAGGDGEEDAILFDEHDIGRVARGGIGVDFVLGEVGTIAIAVDLVDFALRF